MVTGHQETFTSALVLATGQELRRLPKPLIIAVTVQYVGKAFGNLLKVQDVAVHQSPISSFVLNFPLLKQHD